MITNVKARYSNGVLTPLDPLDLEEGTEVVMTVETAPDGVSEETPTDGTESILEMFDGLRESVPPDTWDNMPTDGAKNYKHYLYGHPKEDD